MYLDISDVYLVFVYELVYFVGFVDEYFIGKGMVNRLCDEDGISDFVLLNLIVDFEYWYVFYEMVENWLEIDFVIIIVCVKMCIVLGKNSYKFSCRIIFMEYYDSGVILFLYLVLW